MAQGAHRLAPQPGRKATAALPLGISSEFHPSVIPGVGDETYAETFQNHICMYVCTHAKLEFHLSFISLVSPEFHLNGVLCCFRDLRGFVGIYAASLGYTRFRWDLRGFAEIYAVSLGFKRRAMCLFCVAYLSVPNTLLETSVLHAQVRIVSSRQRCINSSAHYAYY
eukprot:7338661-Alexandrium_andersonii.AAC.1